MSKGTRVPQPKAHNNPTSAISLPSLVGLKSPPSLLAPSLLSKGRLLGSLDFGAFWGSEVATASPFAFCGPLGCANMLASCQFRQLRHQNLNDLLNCKRLQTVWLLLFYVFIRYFLGFVPLWSRAIYAYSSMSAMKLRRERDLAHTLPLGENFFSMKSTYENAATDPWLDL